MGEIRIDRNEFLYELDYIDILMIGRGYDRKIYHDWSRARWMAYHIMVSFAGSKAMRENRIYGPADLLPLPWDAKKERQYLSEEEKKELQEDMKTVTW